MYSTASTLILTLVVCLLSQEFTTAIAHDGDSRTIRRTRIGHDGDSRTISRTRIRRDHGKQHFMQIDVLAVADYSVYEFAQQQSQNKNHTHGMSSEDAFIHHHLKRVVKEIDFRFDSLRQGNINVRMNLADLIVIKDKSNAIWLTESVQGQLDAPRTLSSFKRWIEVSGQLGNYDHAILFTRYDLSENNSKTVAGLAFLNSMCYDSSVSIVEDREMSHVATIAAHELAHSLGVPHDGNGNTCSSLDNYIMSDTSTVTRDVLKNRNSWKFSQCSVEYVRRYIHTLNRHGQNCLVKKDNAAVKGEASRQDVTSAQPEIPSPDEQCKLIEGKESRLCRTIYEGNFTAFCALMYCRLDETTCTYRLPRDGTMCGQNKICHFGFCIQTDASVSGTNKSVVFKADACPFGNQPGIIASEGTTCAIAVQTKSFLCYNKVMALMCCESCTRIYRKEIGCEYGDKKERCSSTNMFDCICDHNTCCETCSKYVDTISALKFPAVIACGCLILFVITTISVCICRRYRNRKKKQLSASLGNNGERNTMKFETEKRKTANDGKNFEISTKHTGEMAQRVHAQDVRRAVDSRYHGFVEQNKEINRDNLNRVIYNGGNSGNSHDYNRFITTTYNADNNTMGFPSTQRINIWCINQKDKGI